MKAIQNQMRKRYKRYGLNTDIFGNFLFIKRIIIFILGFFTYNRYNGFNELKITGTEHLVDLPDTHVLIVSNHQTYFADVFAMYHVFCSVKNGFINSIQNPVYLLNPKLNLYYVAARETMNKGLLPKLFKYTGAVTVKRSWRNAGQAVQRTIDRKDPENIEKALRDGWVITFPQGTTKAFTPGRKGTANIIKRNRPIVVPVVIDGFRRAYGKKGIVLKKRGVVQTMRFKPPLEVDYERESVREILSKVMDAIEQSSDFLRVKPREDSETRD